MLLNSLIKLRSRSRIKKRRKRVVFHLLNKELRILKIEIKNEPLLAMNPMKSRIKPMTTPLSYINKLKIENLE